MSALRMMGKTAGSVLLYAFLTGLAAFALLPFWWALVSSFKHNTEIYAYPPRLLPPRIDFTNYANLFGKQFFPRWFANSVALAMTSTFLVLFFCSLAGFAFAKYDFRLRNVLFAVMMGSVMIPFQLTMTPLYAEMNALRWLNTYWAVIVPEMAPAFGIFLMRQYMVTIPSELVDSARIDGCSEFRIYAQIVLPLARPALGTLAIYSFMGSWNSYLWPLIVLRDAQLYTLPIGLAAMQGQVVLKSVDYGMVMAGALVSAVPIIIVFLLMQRQFISGLTLGAVKA